MNSSNFDESEIPWLLLEPRTTAERSAQSRMEYDQRYVAVEFANRSFDLAAQKGGAARRRGESVEACPVRKEWDGSEGALRMAWEIGWQEADEEIFFESL